MKGLQAIRLRQTIEAMKKIGADQSKDMQGWIAVADKSADAAKKSADVAERALVDVQRALVVPTRFQCDTMIRNGQIVAYLVTAIFENTGTTIAKRFTGAANVVMWDGQLPDDFMYPDRTDAGSANAFVGPRTLTPYPIAIAIQDILDIMNKKKMGFVYGWVEYKDVFKDTARRRTEFCVQIEITGDPTVLQDKGAAPSVLGFGVYGKYNGTDEDFISPDSARR